MKLRCEFPSQFYRHVNEISNFCLACNVSLQWSDIDIVFSGYMKAAKMYIMFVFLWLDQPLSASPLTYNLGSPYLVNTLIRGVFMVFNTSLNNISVISWRSVLLVEEVGVPGEDHRPVASHWQILSHNVVSSISPHEWGSNSR